MGRKWTDAEKQAASEKTKARLASQPQTNTLKQNPSTDFQQLVEETASPVTTRQDTVTLTAEQFEALLDRLQAGRSDKAPAPSMTAGVGLGAGLQTNSWGQVVGTITKFETDFNYYPSPIEQLAAEPRLTRFAFEENYFLTWDITSKPYETKDKLSMREPTFHITLYMTQFDDQGEETGKAIVIQTLHFNEDEGVAMDYAAEIGFEPTSENMRELMDKTRYERAKRWLLNIFYPERAYNLSEQASEQAIGGQVVKVVTKSNVQGFGNKPPIVTDDELK